MKETKKLTLEKESIQDSLNELKENYFRKEEELVDVSFYSITVFPTDVYDKTRIEFEKLYLAS